MSFANDVPPALGREQGLASDAALVLVVDVPLLPVPDDALAPVPDDALALVPEDALADEVSELPLELLASPLDVGSADEQPAAIAPPNAAANRATRRVRPIMT
jgi:hypothetical protein